MALIKAAPFKEGLKGVVMARLTHVSLVGVPVHIYQRGNNHQVGFTDEVVFVIYLGWLKKK